MNNLSINLDEVYILNPSYLLLPDKNRIILTFKDRFNTDAITSFLHPMHAFMFSLFKGDKTLREIINEIIEFYKISEDEAVALVCNFIENKKQVILKYDGIRFGFPQNLLVKNLEGSIRTDMNEDTLEIDSTQYDFESRRLNIARRVLFILNMQCQTDCIYCYADRETKHTMMPLQKTLDIIDEMKSYGIIELNISGGDIFANNHWYEILKKMYSTGYSPYISTKIPITEQDIEKLKEIGVRQIQISLDTLDPRLITQNLGVPSAYIDKIKKTIHHLDKQGISIILKSTVTKHTCTIENISELLAFANNLNNMEKYTFTPFGYSHYKTVEHFNDFKPSLDQIMDVKDLLENIIPSSPFKIHIDDSGVTDGSECANNELFRRNNICSGNMDSIVILPDGKVTICEELYWNENFIIGDLMTQSIQEIWDSSRAVSLWNISREEFPESSFCKKCNDFDQCRPKGKACWKKVIAAYGRENWLYPEITCPKAPKPRKEIFYDNSFIKTAVLSLFFFLSFFGLNAQNTIKITGKITDLERKPISSASVALYNAANAQKSFIGTVSNSEGLFVLNVQPEASALLKIKHLVFEDDEIRIQLLRDTTLNIILVPKSHLLGEVTVTGTHPKYRINDDGNMVVSVERIPGFETNSVFDLMKKLPGIIATEDQGISLNGKNVEIMIDNRRMPYTNTLALLKSLPAYSLNEIELISIKGAEYDADSQEAIINLKTKQQRLEGYFGNVGVLGRVYFNGSYVDAGNVFLMLKAKKTAFSTMLSYEDYKVKGSGKNTTFLNNTDQTIVRAGSLQDKEQHYTSNSTFQWDIATGHSLYANLSLFGGQLDRIETSDYTNNITHTNVLTLTGRDAPRFLISGNVEYRLGSLLTVNYGYVRGKSGYDEDIENIYPVDSVVPVIHNENNLESQHTSKIDFRKQAGKLTVRSGLKGTFSRQENSSIYTADVPVSYRNIDFSANENIMGGYIGLDYKISDKINATVASRVEYTDYSIENRQLSAAASPNYWNYFPSARVTVKIRPWYTLTTSLNSGLNRPRYKALLPGERYVDDYNYTSGNPNLKPMQFYTLAMQNTLSLQNTFINKINVFLDATYYKNNINNVRVDMGNGISATTSMNAADSRSFSASVSTPFNLLKEKLGGNINISAKTGQYMNERNGYVLPTRRMRPQSVKLSGFFNYQLTKTIGVTANVLYSAINQTLQIEYDPYTTLDLGVNMNLLKSERLSVGLNVVDVFNSKKSRYKLHYSNNLFVSDIAIPTQYIGLAISYRFNGGKQFNPKINAEGNDTGRFTK